MVLDRVSAQFAHFASVFPRPLPSVAISLDRVGFAFLNPHHPPCSLLFDCSARWHVPHFVLYNKYRKYSLPPLEVVL
eukprot:COSAG02_NODE_5223_length_4527_cov_35.869919_3_plen_77_part_00